MNPTLQYAMPPRSTMTVLEATAVVEAAAVRDENEFAQRVADDLLRQASTDRDAFRRMVQSLSMAAAWVWCAERHPEGSVERERSLAKAGECVRPHAKLAAKWFAAAGKPAA